MTSVKSLWVVFLGVSMSAACAKKSAEEAPTPIASATPVPTVTAAAAASVPPLPTAALGLFERLAKERASRPTATPRADEVIGAITKAGVKLDDESQVYAATVKASYCEAAKGSDVFVSVCEYAGEAEAQAGRDYSAKTFAAIANRQIYVNKKTTLTIGQATPSPKGDADTKRAAAAFAKL